MERPRAPRAPGPALAWAVLIAVALAAGPGVSALGVARSMRLRARPYLLAPAARGRRSRPAGAARSGPPRARYAPLPLALSAAALPETVRQSSPRSCGPAALATVLAWLGRPVGEAAVLGRARVRADGVTLAELARLAGVFQLAAGWYAVPPADLPRLPVPFIAHLRAGGGHYVAVARVGRGFVLLADPAVGLVVERRARFRRAWSGRVLLFEASAAGGSR